jgi:phosphoribosylformylglycinamidine cyclo-ligase
MAEADDNEMTYSDAGVDLDKADEAVDRYKDSVASTQIPGVLDEIGGFGGLFGLKEAGFEPGESDPVLVSGTDGVGTKLKIAFRTDRHDTIGIDCVAMCVNDVITTGARPLFFLDYMSTGELDPGQAADVVEGMAEGCRRSRCAMLGGETAEMPGFYPEGEYDIAGFCVGAAERSELLDPADVEPGDAIIGIDSSGIHSNGFSLVRRIVDQAGWALDEPVADLESDRPLGELLLEPTIIYAEPVARLLADFEVHALANITGGGLPGNVPRALPAGLTADIDRQRWEPAPIFELLRRAGNVPLEECYRVFNMGIGFVVIAPEDQAAPIVETLEALDHPARVIGTVRPEA